MVFERTLSDDLSFLANEGQAFIGIKCRAGGWANPELVRLRDEIQVWRQSKMLAMTPLSKDAENYAKESASIDRQVGIKMFEAIFDACVVEWWTNIQDDGKPMKCNRDNLLALADVRIDEISQFFMDFARYVDQLGNFRDDIDKEAAKN